MQRLLYLLVTLLLAAGCKQNADTGPERVVITGIDSSIKPGDDFFMYVNRIWYDTAQIPAGQSGVGSYSFLNYPQRIRMQGILDSLSGSTSTAGSLEQKVGDFYASGMDTSAINKRSYEPIRPLLTAIDGVTGLPSFMKLVAEEHKQGNGSMIGLYIGPDDKQSTVNIVQLSQAGIGLPERDYYFKSD